MTSRFLVLTAILCLLLNVPVSGSPDMYGDYSDQPTSGGEKVFATKSDVMLNTIQNLIDAKDYQRAEELAKEVTTTSPDMVDGWLMLGYTRSLNARYEASNEAYDKAMEYGADPKDVLLRKAYNCRKMNSPDLTRECFEQILEIADDPEVRMQFGAFESAAGNYEAASAHYLAVLELQPENIQAIEAMSRIEEKMDRPTQEKYWIEKGIQLEPENTRFLKRLSLIYLNEQNYDLSIHFLARLLEVDPTDSGAYRNMGIAYYQRGDKQSAKDSFEKVRELGGKMKGLYGPLADCYRSTGSRGDALRVIQEGIEQEEQKAWLYSLWGKLLEDEKQYDAAIHKFSIAVDLKDEPWSGYARKQIARQQQLIKRAELIARQQEEG